MKTEILLKATVVAGLVMALYVASNHQDTEHNLIVLLMLWNSGLALAVLRIRKKIVECLLQEQNEGGKDGETH